MKLKLLKNKTTSEEIEVETKSLVIVGANGAGKTRFSTALEKKYNNITHRISAQKSLSMPFEVSPKTKEKAEAEFLYGYHTNSTQELDRYKVGQRWGNKPNTFLLNDYDKLMVLLHTEEYEEAINYKDKSKVNSSLVPPTTKLDRIQEIFEYVISHRKLIKKAGTIETHPVGEESKKYNASEMSDGERIVFYLIGEVICTKENSLIIIDEPENHLHKSITKKLWDKIEQERPDCTFVYLTHDIDFAVSRQDSKKIWMKSYNGNEVWDYEVLDEESPLPEQLYLEVLGSRKPILFIEGELDSIDYKFYEQIFKDHTVKPLGSCDKVFEATSSFNDLKGFHHIDSFGLIDRDRRTEEQINHISDKSIWVSKVAEVESFLLLEDIVKIIAQRMGKNGTEVFNNVQERIINEFKNNLEREATQYTLHIIKNNFEKQLNPRVSDFSELSETLNSYWEEQDFEKIYNEIKEEFEQIIHDKDYNRVLEVYNNKGLVHKAQIASECDLNNRNNAYLNQILNVLKTNTEESEKIRESVLNMIYKN